MKKLSTCREAAVPQASAHSEREGIVRLTVQSDGLDDAHVPYCDAGNDGIADNKYNYKYRKKQGRSEEWVDE
ncbi:hypothetical protein CVT26_006914 [Gymnopilus dilepis]|uniref:Uncharacterized protein n=1 Tax=Gymnopilus dilepis TaxID=231916 RepID=A0A409W0X6_9AGAR|nr:hypothetical protein CVT26_006914 [Gymnopilus dilepis]